MRADKAGIPQLFSRTSHSLHSVIITVSLHDVRGRESRTTDTQVYHVEGLSSPPSNQYFPQHVHGLEYESSPERVAGGESLEREGHAVRVVEGDSVAPPHHDIILAYRAIGGVLQAEEYDNCADGDTRVEGGGQDV